MEKVENKTHHPLVRTIYLYLFALLGLVLLVISGVRFINMGLKMFVFTKAEEERRLLYQKPPVIPIEIEKLKDLEKSQEEICFSGKDRTTIKQWLADYNDWKKRRSKIDPVVSQRHREASLNLAMILVGLPLYLYHWRTIKRETKG